MEIINQLSGPSSENLKKLIHKFFGEIGEIINFRVILPPGIISKYVQVICQLFKYLKYFDYQPPFQIISSLVSHFEWNNFIFVVSSEIVTKDNGSYAVKTEVLSLNRDHQEHVGLN